MNNVAPEDQFARSDTSFGLLDSFMTMSRNSNDPLLNWAGWTIFLIAQSLRVTAWRRQ